MQAENKNEAAPEASELNEFNPSFIEHRLKLWEKFKERYEQDLKAKQSATEKITVETVDKNGAPKSIDGQSWITTPMDIAKQVLHKQWCDSLVIAKVNGVLWDLNRPLEGNCSLELLKFDEQEGQQVFWHSSAHILGEAMERLYGGHLCYGPPIDNGFYYDVFMCDASGQVPAANKPETGDLINGCVHSTVSQSHFPKIESVMKSICDEKQPFERLELSKDELLQLFDYNKFKVRILKEKVTDDRTTVYRCGTLIDLCRGPHVLHTGHVKAFKVTKASSSYWEGKA
ncbi:threonine-tRNA ligase: cytoplasmic-like protein, partial [Leptotrombidium deliense]